LPILGAAAAGLFVVAILCAVVIAVAIAVLLNRRRVPQAVARIAVSCCLGALIIGIAAGVLAAIFATKC
jgi:hypothetical protein